MPAAAIDWTTIGLWVLSGILTVLGWGLRQYYSTFKEHMTKVEAFMGTTNERHAVLQTKIEHHDERFAGVERWITGLEQRVNNRAAQQMEEVHGMVSVIHGNCGKAG